MIVILLISLAGCIFTPREPEGEPVKVGVGIADIMTGMYCNIAILAALVGTGIWLLVDVGVIHAAVTVHVHQHGSVAGRAPGFGPA